MSESHEPVDPVAAGHEGSQVGASVAVNTIVSVVVLLGGAFWMTSLFIGGLERQPDPLQNDRSELARVKTPTVRLDPAQPASRRNLEAAQNEILDSYGWVKEPAGVARIPIEVAMTRLVEEGLPANDTPEEETNDSAEGGQP